MHAIGMPLFLRSIWFTAAKLVILWWRCRVGVCVFPSSFWSRHGFIGVFATINYLYTDSLLSLIGAGRVYGILSTVAIGSHILLPDRFSVIHYFKRFHQQNLWIGCVSLNSGLLNAFLLHTISDLMLAFVSAFIVARLLMTVFCEELSAANSTRLLWFIAGSGGMAIRLIISMLNHA